MFSGAKDETNFSSFSAKLKLRWETRRWMEHWYNTDESGMVLSSLFLATESNVSLISVASRHSSLPWFLCRGQMHFLWSSQSLLH